jgi:small-conductance mechanosensitive channel
MTATSSLNEHFIHLQNLYALLDFEPFTLLCSLILLSWFFYKIFLRDVTQERHQKLKLHFSNLLRHFLILATLFATAVLLKSSGEETLLRALPYVALFCLLWGMIVFVKTCGLIILQYLFLGSMKHGVPVLIVNIFSLILSIILALWCAAAIFYIQVGPLLATSAALSVILGLALQDTLGNLFAGISLQVDKAFEIGDWIEVTSGIQKCTGQVKEITWRATVLAGWNSDELITLPNRFLAGAQIANYSLARTPILRSALFRLPMMVDIRLAKQCLLESIKEVRTVRAWPEPVALITETTESWIVFKLYYYIDNFGSQTSIGDQVNDAAIRYLRANNIGLALNQICIVSP